LLEIAMLRQSSDDVAQTLLAEIAVQLRADHVGVWEATPTWVLRWHYARPGSRVQLEAIPRNSLNEVLDRQASFSQAPSGPTLASLAEPSLAAKYRSSRTCALIRAGPANSTNPQVSKRATSPACRCATRKNRPSASWRSSTRAHTTRRTT